jgi:hypothetical protein
LITKNLLGQSGLEGRILMVIGLALALVSSFKRTLVHVAASVKMGSLLPLAAFVHQKN